MDMLLDEVDALEAILMDDVKISRDESGTPTQIETTVLPIVGEETDRQYVCVTLQVMPTAGYPDTSPTFNLRNPRGLDDHSINQIRTAVTTKLTECIGSPVVFDLIEVIREHLTNSNLPTGQCVVCLYGFQDGDQFTKMECYHYLHSFCLARHLIASKNNYDEELAKLPAWQRLQAPLYQPVCPVCREPIGNALEPLRAAQPPTELENAPTFHVTAELRDLQTRMAELMVHQKSRGGIIDVAAADSGNVISIDSGEQQHGGEASKVGSADCVVAAVVTVAAPTAQNNNNAQMSKAAKQLAATQKQKAAAAARTQLDPAMAGSGKEDRGERERHHHHGGGRRHGGGNRFHGNRRHHGHGRQEVATADAAGASNDAQPCSSGNTR